MKKVNITNRKGSYDYELLKDYTAGISLLGTEVKSIKNGNVSITDTYCTIVNGELYVHGLYVKDLKFGDSKTHENLRTKKLLLKKKELIKLQTELIKGLTIIPYCLFENDKGLLKLRIYLAKGKKSYDKRNSIKERDLNREVNKNLI